jgi:hypothetical protein
MKTFFITGTFHGAIFYGKTEGEARRAFHSVYGGESIISVKEKQRFIYP